MSDFPVKQDNFYMFSLEFNICTSEKSDNRKKTKQTLSV